jgi:hypothetical protein
VLTSNGGLYRSHAERFATVDVAGGRMSFDSVIDAPFGYRTDLDLSQFESVEEWTVDG